ncbi:MAG: HlyD family efflux transporter periplasmic adaptor subunit [Alphaproteobacteria bacterium]|nr:HlyD family efflux transporter periplasmic adaptor subunit [Alphaproteobacteria bacterium]
MEVSPSRRLIVEANVLNRDAGFVHEGQSVRVKLEAFPFTRYGAVDGTLEFLSRDAITDETLGLIFPARIELSQEHISVSGVRRALTPGMAVTAEIKTGRRRIIEFLLSPIARRVEEAGRERWGIDTSAQNCTLSFYSLRSVDVWAAATRSTQRRLTKVADNTC